MSIMHRQETCPACGVVHRSDPPEWLPEAAALAKQGVPCHRIACQFRVEAKTVRYWLPHAGVLASTCAEENCDTEIGPGSQYCREHSAQHRAPPPRHQTRKRPENIASIAPSTAHFDSFEAWIDAALKALVTTVSELSQWCDLDQTTLWRLRRHPDMPLSPKTQQRLHDVLGADIGELERLRPSRQRRSEAGKQAVQTRREQYGDEALSEWGRRGMLAFQQRHTPEQLHGFQRIGAAAAGEKTRGKNRDPELVKSMRQRRWGAGPQRTKRKSHFRLAISKRRPPGTGARIVEARKQLDSDWAAKNRYALHKRRRKLAPECYALCRELFTKKVPLIEIARQVGELAGSRVSETLVKRMLGELALRPMPPGYLTLEQARDVWKGANPQQAGAFASGRVIGQQTANDNRANQGELKCQAGWDLLVAEGREPHEISQTMLVNRTWEMYPNAGVHAATARKFLSKKRQLPNS